MGKPSDYHLMTIAEKHERNRIDEVPDRCPDCHIAVMPVDEPEHAERCKGRPEPGRRARWLRLKEATDLGVPKRALCKLAAAGKIRTRGERGQKRYLKRDIHKHKANRIRRARQSEAKANDNALTMPSKTRKARTVTKEKDLKKRVAAFVESAGSYSAASRKLDVPVGSLKRAANGESIRKGTKLLILNQLREVGE